MMLFAEDAPIFTSILDATTPARSDDVLFCYQDQTVGLTDNKAMPSFGAFSGQVPPESLYCFGEIETGQKCFFTEILPETLQFTEIRTCLLYLPTQLRQAVVIGGYLYRWRRLNTYCGQCKAEMEDSRIERARLCPACGNIVYPRISPCIIVLVTRGDEILLARSPHFSPGIYSTLAGFINIGETVEHAVHREVREEVGIEISDLVYQGSQPWLFPDSLMLAFTAKYVSGEIQIDGNEIESAAWFHRDALPELPTGISIARCLIDDYLNEIEGSVG